MLTLMMAITITTMRLITFMLCLTLSLTRAAMNILARTLRKRAGGDVRRGLRQRLLVPRQMSRTSFG